MNKPGWLSVWGGVAVLSLSVLVVGRAEDGSDSSPAVSSESDQLPVEHPECVYFTGDRERFMDQTVLRRLNPGRGYRLSAQTAEVTRMLSYIPPDSQTYTFDQGHPTGSIDSYIFGAMKANNITPAPKTSDVEFIRRVTLDLTGRIPTPARVITFNADTSPDKRAKLVDELLNSPEWIDKWTMFYGDLFQNTATKSSTGLNRFPQGRNAFYQWIKDSLTNNKPYNQMATELITTAADNSFNDGRINYLVGGVVTGGPSQDIMDQMTANTFDTFLGITHVNCLLCHNGRGHLDQLSLWGSRTTRYQAWQLAAFLSHTQAANVKVTSGTTTLTVWSLLDNTKGFTLDYTLNTKTGNRPARVAPAGCKPGQPCYYVPPQYIFNNNGPQAGENYRAALARNITGDFQFARAAVNYLWAYFFGQGLVDPPDTFDPMRLDPNNPPPAPWTLQPSNPALLNALAQHFIDSGYNLKATMREIVNSDAYQLSSRYDGPWDPAWEPLFARKLVRRLWAEEIHDAVAQSSNVIPSYTITQNGATLGTVNRAIQFPETAGMPAGNAAVVQFLDAFLRGNRDDQQRRGDGSISHALDLMNDNFIMSRIRATGSGASASLLARSLSLPDDQLVNNLFLAVLSRYPTPAEMSTALANLQSGDRTQEAQNLLWSLYNKVDFVFNY